MDRRAKLDMHCAVCQRFKDLLESFMPTFHESHSLVAQLAEQSAVNRSSPSQAKHDSDPNVLMFTSQVAEYTGFKQGTLQAWRYNGGGPKFVKIGQRAIRYRRRDLDEWIEARIRMSTSDPG